MLAADGLSHAALAALGREYMLFGHLLNRAALPHVHAALGGEAREAVAIDEWMGASPVYTQRMRRRLRFEGDDVEAIFKGFQLDVGFPHHYMDVRYRLERADRGEFWLASCGALLEVEPHGDAAVRSMCHTIEDPTFDATAVATNPRARCRPLHRPPRVPADRTPHCHWEVVIDAAANPIVEPAITRRVRASRLAAVALPAEPDDGAAGWRDYRRPFEPAFRLEMLSRSALAGVCREFLVQNHLLVRALMLSVAERGGEELSRRIATAQWIGAGAVAAARLRRLVSADAEDAAAIAAVLRLHPAFLVPYVGLAVVEVSPDRARLAIGEGEAFHEADGYGWHALLGDEVHPALDAMVQAVNPHARCVPTMPEGSERFAWDVVVDSTAAPATMRPEVTMVAASHAAAFAFPATASPTPAR